MSSTARADLGPTIAIIGAGFSGVVTAARLLAAAAGPVRIVMINRSGPSARGVAYGTRTDAHVLNVPAGRMSAYPEDEDDFLRFAVRRVAGATGGSFLPRSLFGAYLDFVLARAAQSAVPGALVETVVGEVTGIETDGAGCRLRFDDERALLADAVVLAVGNYPPADPGFLPEALRVPPRYLRDPWVPHGLERIGRGERVLLLGTGLTMADVAIAIGGRVGAMTAVSRRGVVSAAHRDPGVPPTGDHLPADLTAGPATALGYLRSVRRQIARETARGGDWRDVIAALRPVTPALWTRLPDRERARFLRHLKPYWEAHRHRAAPAQSRALDELRAGGRLEVVAGTVVRVSSNGRELTVTIRRRRGGEMTAVFDRLVNCTGPASDLSVVDDPLIRSLVDEGRIRPDRHRLGLGTSDEYQVLDRDGRPAERIFYVGPLLRATHWEATAVPELRVHAMAVASAVARCADL